MVCKAVILFLSGGLAFAQNAGSPNEGIFRQQIAPVLQAKCSGCHSSASASGGLVVADFSTILAGGKHGSSILPGNSKSSLLVQYLRGERQPKMPMGGSLDDQTVSLIAKAIDEMKPSENAGRKPDAYLDWLLHKPASSGHSHGRERVMGEESDRRFHPFQT